MTSKYINDFLNEYASGQEKDHYIECTRNQYGVVKIVVRAKQIPCSCCKGVVAREKLIPKKWTDGQGMRREARMCTECSAIAKDLYGI